MPELDDQQLLREFAETHSEMAFATLVERYVNLVYSTALRFSGNPQLAEEISQAVFIILARKAKSFGGKTVLSGWLYQTARLTAANVRKSEVRRQGREQEACMQTILNEPDAIAWERIAPLLDDAMGKLGETDRNAVVLRFFENKTAAEVAAKLNLTEAAAYKRVNRALEKLRKFFARRGVNSTTAILAGTISANSVQAAPVGLAKTVSTVAIAKGATASVSTLTLIKGALKIMAWSNAKTAVVVGTTAIALTLGVGYFSFFNQSYPNQIEKSKLPTGNVTPMIAYGYSHFGVVLASDGSLWSWGEEELGWPTLGISNIQKSIALRQIGKDADWVDVSADSYGCLAIKSDGSLWAWGGNFNYQLGDGTKINRPTPVRSIPGNDWKQVANGGGTSFALKDDGTLWGWGNNWSGELGTGPKICTNAVQVGTSTNWVKIWAGNIQTVGQQSDGSLWFWGSISGGGDDTNQFHVPTRISSDTNWTDVCFGYFTVFAIKSDGTLWSWGSKANFYTGEQDTNLNSTPVQVGTDNDWQSCASAPAGFYTLLKKKDGSFWAMDASEHRIVKPAAAYRPISFEKLSLPRGVVAFTAGGDNIGIVLTREGEVWTWGNVIGEHDASDYFGPRRGERKFPKIKVRNKPWQLTVLYDKP